jgi:hypothetical protein
MLLVMREIRGACVVCFHVLYVSCVAMHCRIVCVDGVCVAVCWRNFKDAHATSHTIILFVFLFLI